MSIKAECRSGPAGCLLLVQDNKRDAKGVVEPVAKERHMNGGADAEYLQNGLGTSSCFIQTSKQGHTAASLNPELSLDLVGLVACRITRGFPRITKEGTAVKRYA